MTIPGKIEASRSNSLKSTGPKTLRGRSLSRFNAVKHGVFSTRSLLPGEDQAEFNELSAILFDEYKPMTTIERILVERLVAGKLRIDRIERAKSAYFEEIRWSILVRTLRTLTHDEFEVAKSIVPNKELLRAAGNARANQKLEMLAATLGLQRASPKNRLFRRMSQMPCWTQ